MVQVSNLDKGQAEYIIRYAADRMDAIVTTSKGEGRTDNGLVTAISKLEENGTYTISILSELHIDDALWYYIPVNFRQK